MGSKLLDRLARPSDNSACQHDSGETVAMLAQAQKMAPRFARTLLTLLALLMAARARKRSAVADLRELAAALGSAVPRSKTDLTEPAFAALHRQVKGLSLTPEQNAVLDRGIGF